MRQRNHPHLAKAALAALLILSRPSKAAAQAEAPVIFPTMQGQAVAPPQMVADLSLQRALMGGAAAHKKLKDLDGGWRVLTLGGLLDDGGSKRVTTALLTSLAGGITQGVYYTRGETVMGGGETYVVAYHAPIVLPDFNKLMEGKEKPKVPALTPDTSLDLILLNARTSGSLYDIRPFDLNGEIAENQKKGVAEGLAAQAQAQAQTRTSLNNLRLLGIATMAFAADNGGKLPPLKDAATARKALAQYVSVSEDFNDPRSQQPYRPNAWLSGRRQSAIAAPAQVALFYAPKPDDLGDRETVFLDGHAAIIPAARWPAVKAASHLP